MKEYLKPPILYAPDAPGGDQKKIQIKPEPKKNPNQIYGMVMEI